MSSFHTPHLCRFFLRYSAQPVLSLEDKNGQPLPREMELLEDQTRTFVCKIQADTAQLAAFTFSVWLQEDAQDRGGDSTVPASALNCGADSKPSSCGARQYW